MTVVVFERFPPEYLGDCSSPPARVHYMPNQLLCYLFKGVVKMNVDTDTQWAYWAGILQFYKAKEG